MNLMSTPTDLLWDRLGRKWRPILPHSLTLLSSVLVVLAFPPWNFSFLMWFCLVPWFFAIHQASTLRQAFREGFWLSFFMTLGGYYWVAYSIQEFGGVPWAIGILGLLLFCLVGQPQFLLFPLILKMRPSVKQNLFTLIWLSLLYVGIDWFVPKMFLDTLGHAFYQAPRLRQLADLGGVSLITFLIILTQLTVFKALQTLAQHRLSRKATKPIFSPPIRELVPQLLFTGVLILGALTYGHFRQSQILETIQTAPDRIQIAAIQGNIGDFDKVAAENDTYTAAIKVIDTFTALSDRALGLSPKPEALIWPETSFPSLFRQPSTPLESVINERVENYARQHGVPLLFGGYDRQQSKEFNSFFFLEPNGQLQTYHKSKLLMFGEYLPGADTFQILKDTFPQVGNFGQGPGPQVFELRRSDPLRTVRVSPIICYEALFPKFLLESAQNHSQMIINITNDSWFGNWGEPQLHLALTTFRSIETRLPMLRSTNTGISTLIGADGEIQNATQIGTQEILNVSVPITQPIWTLVKAWGDWFGLVALILGLLGFLQGGWPLVRVSKL